MGIPRLQAWEEVKPLLFAVPVALLLIAGLAVGRGSGTTDPSSAAPAGGATVTGYGILAILGIVAFGTDNVAPELVTSILLAGVVYPVALGALGGAGAALTADS